MKKIIGLITIVFVLAGCTTEEPIEKVEAVTEAMVQDTVDRPLEVAPTPEVVEPIESPPAPEEAEVVEESLPIVESPEVVPEEPTQNLTADDFVEEPTAEVVTSGEENQVSTIFGTGTAAQTETSMYYPAYTQVADNGEIYFVDGDIKDQKIRKISGGKIITVVDLVNNKINDKGDFYAVGLLHMGKDLLMVADVYDMYYVDGDKIHRVPGDVPKYMEDHQLQHIWRMKKQGDKVYVMFLLKGHSDTYHTAEYDINTNTLTPIIDRADYNKPSNFYVDGNNIYVAMQLGFIYREQLFPRQTTAYYNAEDSKVVVMDVWKTAGDKLMFSVMDGVHAWVMKDIGDRDFVNIGGATRGYQDGVLDEIKMDNPMDFTYDGTGYIFADPGNHVIRKLWTQEGPKEDI
jgi:hypothetical protein